MNGQEAEATLRDLWSRRPNLTKAEWTRLYQLIHGFLQYRHWPELQSLRGTREEFIHDFFMDRVFLGGAQGGEIHHSGALAVFFRRYLISLLRAPHVRHRQDEDGRDSGEVPPSDPADAPPALGGAEEKPLHVSSRDPARDLLDLVAEEVRGILTGKRQNPQENETFTSLREHYGLWVPEILASARGFLTGQGLWEQLRSESGWILLYLREHFCPENGIALDALRRRHQLASHHYKALKLGITVPKGEQAALAVFRGSYRGQWLDSLGIPVDQDHRVEMALALQMLCLVALHDQAAQVPA